MTPGSIAVVNCGDAHSGLVPAGSDYSGRTIRIEPGFLSTCLSQIVGNRQERLSVDRPVIHDRPLSQAILRLYTVLERPGTRLEKEYGLLKVLDALHTRHGRAMSRPSIARDDRMPIRRARDFLQDCYQENTSLAHLASLAGMTPFHFAKAFTRHVGVPPHAYQIQIRLRKATDLLAMGKPHVEVALETGFCDQSHFCRAFKKKFGITPGQYQR
jgi:AraC-like DNA-binding protein